MNKILFLGAVLINSIVFAYDPVLVSHRDFQAVHADGTSSFDDSGPFQVVLQGILLNNPEDWLDPAPNSRVAPWFMGGQWEIFVQGEGLDHAGTACWIGQNYANGPGDFSYTNEQWLAEVYRLNHDPGTGYVFHQGDRVRITGTYLFYAGKLNINENHETDPVFDFKIELIKPGVGLARPDEIHISDLKNPDNSEIFDPERKIGCEYYQCCRVRIEDVNIIDPQKWGIGNTVTIKDSRGLTFPVRLGRGAGISQYPCPSGQIDVIGIIDQKSPGYPPDPTKGYRLLVFNYNGNKLVLGDTGKLRSNLPGDVNHDYIVDMRDLLELTENWLKRIAGLYNSK